MSKLFYICAISQRLTTDISDKIYLSRCRFFKIVILCADLIVTNLF